MTSIAPKDTMSASGSAMMLRAWQTNAIESEHKIVNLAQQTDGDVGSGGGGAAAEGIPPRVLREWSSAVDLIAEASEAIRVGEQRAAELEAQLAHVVAQASEEMRRLGQQVAAGEQKLARSEERARLAEARASDAEAWLVRLHDAAFAAFGSRKTQRTATGQGRNETSG